MEKRIKSYDGTQIWYRKLGRKGFPIILCDGLGCDGYIWKYILADFKHSQKFVHWHYRGHGQSDLPQKQDNLGVEANVNDLEVVRKDAKISKKMVLIGHSLGVQVAFEYYRKHPERVAGIIALNGTYGYVLHHIHNSDIMLRSLPGIRFLTRRLPRSLLSAVWKKIIGSPLAFAYTKAFEVNTSLALSEDLKPYFCHLQQLDIDMFLRTLTLVAHHSVEDILGEIRVPTLVVASEKDRFTPFRLSRRMANMIPNSEFLTLPNGSHVGPLELPELVNPRIKCFLEKLQGKKTLSDGREKVI